MNATLLAGPFLSWLADYYLAATFLLLAVFACWRWIRQPAHRVMATWIVLLELIALAFVCAMPFWPKLSLIAAAPREVVVPLPVMDKQPRVAPRIVLMPDVELNDALHESLNPDVGRSVASPVAPKHQWTWTELIALGYLAGAAMSCVWLGWGAAATMWLCRRADIASDALQAELARISSRHTPCAAGPSALRDCTNLTSCHADGTRSVPATYRVPRLLVSQHVPNAVAVGVLRPTIILPAGLVESSSPAALRAALSHELAHIRNRDLWLLALGRCLLMVLFAHPLFWWLRRVVRGDHELLADAVAAGDNRPDYAEDLLRLIRKTTHPSPMAVSAAMGIWEGSSQLSRRIAMLLDETFCVEPTSSRRWRYSALSVFAVLGAACSLVTLQPARSAEEQAKPKAAAEPKPDAKADPIVDAPAEEANVPASPAHVGQIQIPEGKREAIQIGNVTGYGTVSFASSGPPWGTNSSIFKWNQAPVPYSANVDIDQKMLQLYISGDPNGGSIKPAPSNWTGRGTLTLSSGSGTSGSGTVTVTGSGTVTGTNTYAGKSVSAEGATKADSQNGEGHRVGADDLRPVGQSSSERDRAQ